jgi:DNA-binding CsgD family transcriptional regulator
MRKWAPTQWDGRPALAGQALAGMICQLGQDGFEEVLLEQLHPVLPAASWSVYQVGPRCEPTLFMSASHGIPDTTRDCWWAYLSGPYRNDQSLRIDATGAAAAARGLAGTHLCHITAQEVAGEHRARVYDAHGMVERVSVVRHAADESVFAVNFYRHAHQPALTDGQICAFEDLAPALLALAQKHIALAHGPVSGHGAALHDPGTPRSAAALRSRLHELCPALTSRELDVCTRLLQGLTQEGIAGDLAISLPTVKTYRNRAFERLGIHFRNELFALVLGMQHTERVTGN